jgi:hypothetical protein
MEMATSKAWMKRALITMMLRNLTGGSSNLLSK